MRHEFRLSLQVIAVTFAGTIFGTIATAQDAAEPSLVEQLRTQYKLTKTGSDSTGFVIIEPGVVLTIRQAGLLGVPPGNALAAQQTFKDGELHGVNKLTQGLLGKSSRYLGVGEKVYIRKMDFNLKNDKITFVFFECDSCNGAVQPSSYRVEVIFQFPKGDLGTAKPAQVSDVISQVAAIDTGVSESQQAPLIAPQPEPLPPAPAADRSAPPPFPDIPPPPPSPDQPPPTVSLGQTIDQVVAILGRPTTVIDLGAKKIYNYKNPGLKVTFANGKVTEMQ